ncbi:calcium-binding protein [Mangrovicoccus ximenensis]|uniref:hypothetical protein n=1 Tax=Mangrovicoccus ximenensis TaxID=1911570 RepID=UPI000D35FCF0|nr:hypothetical protein [Mangrovicoccus ximenensis]
MVDGGAGSDSLKAAMAGTLSWPGAAEIRSSAGFAAAWGGTRSWAGSASIPLRGGFPYDELREGSKGNDRLDGDCGRDTRTGGSGADDFILAPGCETGFVTDFQTGRNRPSLDETPCGGGGTGAQTMTDHAAAAPNGVHFGFGTGDLPGLTGRDGLAPDIAFA